MINYKTKGTCSSEISFELSGKKIQNVSFKGGCDGNLKAVSMLVDGMEAEEVINKLKNIRCGRKNTSCAAQLAAAVEEQITAAK